MSTIEGAAASAADQPRPKRLGRIEALLIEAGVVTPEVLATARDRQRGAKRPLLEILLEQQAVDEDLLVRVISDATGFPPARADELVLDPDVQHMVPADVVQRLGIIPLRLRGKQLVVATGDPFQVLAFDELRQVTGRDLHVLFAKPSDVRKAIRGARGDEEVVHELVKNAAGVGNEIEIIEVPDADRAGMVDVERLAETSAPTVHLVNLIVSDGIRSGASDIHIEAEKSAMRVRFRVDGVLRDALVTSATIHPSVVARIKIVARLDIIETRRPQDGRAKVSQGDRSYDLRISTLPSYFGEKVVIRILDSKAATFDLDKCGIEDRTLARWRELIHRPNGLVLMTGPTGSGKTSTLFASLLELRDPSRNIVTVEDPVEYQFEGITHVPVRSDIGMTFAAALRSILRQDPDIVMVGEIRDAETARICLQAAMTGHLVLSTLHTNDAVGAIPRLFDLDVDPALVANSLLGVMAQRLARTVCPSCAQPQTYTEDELSDLIGDADIETPIEGQRGAGCSRCRGSGQRGRTALVELVVATPKMQHLIATRADRASLLAQARRDGTHLLVESGVQKIADGVCTPEDVREVAAAEVEGDDSSSPARAAPTTVVPAAAPIAAPATESASAHVASLAPPPAPPPAPAPAAADTVFCTACGGQVQLSWKFCPACAAPVEVPAGPVVLVCDDDPIARRVACAALRRDFGQVLEASSGAEALDVVACKNPDVLVIDQNMPGLSGIDVIRELRSHLETAMLPILMLTAAQDDETEEESFEAGASDYLRKPISPARLRTRARVVLAAHERLKV